jgi:hypothetical protein
LFVVGIGSGFANAALGRLAVESVSRERAAARYLGGAAGVAVVVALGSGTDASGLIPGWNVAALVSAGLCAVGALIAVCCRTERRSA